ncbi:hypothetical protein AB0I53_32770 [Saccharopolyspora sp. NPDC050389]|uniref:hypothetical protein n=1 Tax=Saccharopolyspora sp. NPDC050389 TaxID=3155516 RepID=UPI0033C89A00
MGNARDYREALGLPLIQHLAELTDQYGLPHDDEPDDGPAGNETESAAETA